MSDANQRPDDDGVLEAYLRDDARAVTTVDGWIRLELRVRFPTLRAEQDDIAQTVHGKLVTIFREGRFAGRSSLKTFVVRVSRYTAVDALRRKHRAPLVDGDLDLDAASPARSPYGGLHDLEQPRLLREILLLAPALCRDLWRLAYVEKLSYKEIGKRLALATGTIKSRMWSCRRKALALVRSLERAPRC